jgi:predicted ATPase
MSEPEFQRRWLFRVTDGLKLFLKTPGGFFDGSPRRDIRDHYTFFERPSGGPDVSRPMRIRQELGQAPRLTFKRPGNGFFERHTTSIELPLGVADDLRDCPAVAKNRFTSTTNHRFVLDIYPKGNGLPELVLLEQGRQGETWDPLPDWVRAFDPVEVTGTLSGAHIALIRQMHNAREHGPTKASEKRPIPTVVLTGGPCSGKTSLLRELQLDDRLHLVPEAATVAISELFCKPPSSGATDSHHRSFQKQVRDLQVLFEHIGQINADERGATLMIVDRGLVDGHAYLTGEDPDTKYIEYFGVPHTHDYALYAAVIHLAPPSREVYEREKSNNPARRETYAEAIALDAAITRAWKDHPDYLRVGDGESWEAKRFAALQKIATLMKR